MQAKTFFGLEEVLATELREIGASKIEILNRAVNFYGDKGFMYKANYSLRTALRILKPIYSFKAFNEDHFYENLIEFPFEDYLTIEDTFSIDATVHSEKFTHSQFMTFKMKDAIVDRFRNKFNERPDISLKNPTVRFNLHISDLNVTISLDSSGDALFKRGYKKSRGEAPINEVLAAGMLKLAGWDGKGNLLDPMCGSGTILIEAAMIATNLPAQLFRTEFGFQNWNDYDESLFEEIKQVRLQRIRDFSGKIVGYDLDKTVIESAKSNIEFAELDEFISIENKDFFESEKNLFPVLVIFNPPYNERLSIHEQTFYNSIGNTLKHHYPNTLAWMITSNLEAIKFIGLKPSRRIKLFNGKLECKFLQFEMYEGSKKTKNQENN